MHEKCHFLGNLPHYNWLKIKKLYVLCRFWYTCIILLTFKISTILYIEFVWLMKVFFYQNLNKGRIITFLVVGGGLGCHLFPFNFLIFFFLFFWFLTFFFNISLTSYITDSLNKVLPNFINSGFLHIVHFFFKSPIFNSRWVFFYPLAIVYVWSLTLSQALGIVGDWVIC